MKKKRLYVFVFSTFYIPVWFEEVDARVAFERQRLHWEWAANIAEWSKAVDLDPASRVRKSNKNVCIENGWLACVFPFCFDVSLLPVGTRQTRLIVCCFASRHQVQDVPHHCKATYSSPSVQFARRAQGKSVRTLLNDINCKTHYSSERHLADESHLPTVRTYFFHITCFVSYVAARRVERCTSV